MPGVTKLVGGRAGTIQSLEINTENEDRDTGSLSVKKKRRRALTLVIPIPCHHCHRHQRSYYLWRSYYVSGPIPGASSQ